MQNTTNTDINSSEKLYNILQNITHSSRKRLSEKLFISLRNAILSGDLEEGYIFPNENELCKKLDIGRSTLREAYAPLETLNLICRTKTGTYVNNESEIKNPMNFNIIAKYSNPKDIMEFRDVIEVAVAYSAAKYATPEDISILKSIVEKMKSNSDNLEVLTVYDFEFHSELARISGNELFLIALKVVKEGYERFAYEVFKRNLIEWSIEDHLEIIKALEKNDSKLAKSIMRKHLKHIKKVALEFDGYNEK